MIAFLPPKAPMGKPPPMIFPRHVRSGSRAIEVLWPRHSHTEARDHLSRMSSIPFSCISPPPARNWLLREDHPHVPHYGLHDETCNILPLGADDIPHRFQMMNSLHRCISRAHPGCLRYPGLRRGSPSRPSRGDCPCHGHSPEFDDAVLAGITPRKTDRLMAGFRPELTSLIISMPGNAPVIIPAISTS